MAIRISGHEDLPAGQAAATRYRYRTAVVVGPWRASRRDALRDAVRNGFAAWAGPPWTDVTWRFPGEIEESAAGGGAEA